MSSLPGPKGNPGFPGPPGIQVSIWWFSSLLYWLNQTTASLFYPLPLILSILVIEIITWGLIDIAGTLYVKIKVFWTRENFKKRCFVLLTLSPVSMEIFVLGFRSRNRLLYSYSYAVGISRVVGVNGLIKNKNCGFPI